MPFTGIPTEPPKVLILEPKIFGDARCFFFKSFNQRDFEQGTGLEVNREVLNCPQKKAPSVDLAGLCPWLSDHHGFYRVSQ
jgi:dTDP-4-dehydrorhamnose 3,5-epimerase-like enzyme